MQRANLMWFSRGEFTALPDRTEGQKNTLTFIMPKNKATNNNRDLPHSQAELN